MRSQWKAGDRVRFNHEHPNGPVRVISALVPGEPMVELEGWSGHFANHLFVSADYPADSIVPRPSPDADDALGAPERFKRRDS